MSKDDYVTGKTLLNPYIEIGVGRGSNPEDHVHLNVSTFADCLTDLIPPFVGNEPTVARKGETHFAIFGVVGRTVQGNIDWAYLNIDEPPISRTLMGYVPGDKLQEKLPIVFNDLTSRLLK